MSALCEVDSIRLINVATKESLVRTTTTTKTTTTIKGITTQIGCWCCDVKGHKRILAREVHLENTCLEDFLLQYVAMEMTPAGYVDVTDADGGDPKAFWTVP